MALWGNTDLVYSAGTVSANLDTKTVVGVVGVTTFTSLVEAGNVITVGTGATYGYAVITGVTSTTLSIASTSHFVSGLTTVPAGTTYFISEEPVYALHDSVYRAPESKTVGYSTSPVFTTVVGVSTVEVSIANTATGSARKFAPTHAGWVGVTTYIDSHGNFRVKTETLVAGSSITGSNPNDNALYPDT
jgi:hypothetical protein